jgi:hypothetical protein
MVNMIIKNLEPVLDSRKSFYGKAKVIIEDGVVKLQSYNTIVAEIDGAGARVQGTYSATTLRHIKDFLYQHGFEVGTKKEIEARYKKEAEGLTIE